MDKLYFPLLKKKNSTVLSHSHLKSSLLSSQSNKIPIQPLPPPTGIHETNAPIKKKNGPKDNSKCGSLFLTKNKLGLFLIFFLILSGFFFQNYIIIFYVNLFLVTSTLKILE